MMKRILLVKTSSLGDVIHNLPVVNDILHYFPDAQIDWVVEESFAQIPHLHPHIHQVLTVAMRRWRKQIFNKNTWAEVNECKYLLSEDLYDFIIDAQGLIKSAVIATWARGDRHGYDKSSIREPFASYFYHQKHAISYDQHAVIRNRTLAALSLGYPTPHNTPNYGIQADEIDLSAINHSLKQAFVIALHGTSKTSKLWSETQWILLGRLLESVKLYLVLPWSSDSEYKRALNISSQLSNAVVLPKLSISQLASIISNAKAAVGVDTGLSHLSAALNVATVAIYTDTNPHRTGVMAGLSPAINLGGIHQQPTAQSVFKALLNIIAELSAL